MENHSNQFKQERHFILERHRESDREATQSGGTSKPYHRTHPVKEPLGPRQGSLHHRRCENSALTRDKYLQKPCCANSVVWIYLPPPFPEWVIQGLLLCSPAAKLKSSTGAPDQQIPGNMSALQLQGRLGKWVSGFCTKEA